MRGSLKLAVALGNAVQCLDGRLMECPTSELGSAAAVSPAAPRLRRHAYVPAGTLARRLRLETVLLAQLMHVSAAAFVHGGREGELCAIMGNNGNGGGGRRGCHRNGTLRAAHAALAEVQNHLIQLDLRSLRQHGRGGKGGHGEK